MKLNHPLRAALVVAALGLAAAAPVQSSTQQSRNASEAREISRAHKATLKCEGIEDASKKKRCLRDARAKHNRALRSQGAASARISAVQTESARVGPDGAAPVAVDKRTPGVPPSPAR